ncbi:MAG: hypothetical protein N2589_00730 [bacterium]|nr:hypothetical protein [bacterium]
MSEVKVKQLSFYCFLVGEIEIPNPFIFNYLISSIKNIHLYHLFF